MPVTIIPVSRLFVGIHHYTSVSHVSYHRQARITLTQARTPLGNVDRQIIIYYGARRWTIPATTGMHAQPSSPAIICPYSFPAFIPFLAPPNFFFTTECPEQYHPQHYISWLCDDPSIFNTPNFLYHRVSGAALYLVALRRSVHF